MLKSAIGFIAIVLSCAGCTAGYVRSVGGDTDQVFSRIYLTDFDTAWAAVLETLKSSPIEISNREAGFVRTKWIDNTAQRNLVESFGPGKTYVKAQYRFRISVARGYFDGEPSVKVLARKEQFSQYDALEGWKPVVSDSIDENTLLYRIGRVILIRMNLARLDAAKAEMQGMEEDEISEDGDSSEWEASDKNPEESGDVEDF